MVINDKNLIKRPIRDVTCNWDMGRVITGQRIVPDPTGREENREDGKIE